RLGDAAGALRCGNAPEEAMACVRRPHAARLLVAIQRERIRGFCLAPELLFERRAKPLRLIVQPRGAMVIAQRFGHPRRTAARLVDVALPFAPAAPRGAPPTAGAEHRR